MMIDTSPARPASAFPSSVRSTASPSHVSRSVVSIAGSRLLSFTRDLPLRQGPLVSATTTLTADYWIG